MKQDKTTIFPAGRVIALKNLRTFWLVANQLLSSCNAPDERKFSTVRLREPVEVEVNSKCSRQHVSAREAVNTSSVCAPCPFRYQNMHFF